MMKSGKRQQGRGRNTSNPRASSVMTIGLIAVLVAGVGFAAVGSPSYWATSSAEDPVATGALAKNSAAVVKIDREEAELGTMSVSDVRSANFTLTNVGAGPLEVSQVGTSCMCTFAQIAIGGQKSPEFNMAMHNSSAANNWKGVIQPGETATVTVTYKPSLMPVEGSVARNAKFATNDPQHRQAELGIHATVQ